MELKIKQLHKDAKLPKYANPLDAGLDLVAVDKEYDQANGVISYSTGLAFEIPEGYVGLLFPRSSVYKTNLSLSNCVGVLDAGYRGEVSFKFKINGNKVYDVGARIGQLVVVKIPKMEPKFVDELTDTVRGQGGYGSTGV